MPFRSLECHHWEWIRSVLIYSGTSRARNPTRGMEVTSSKHNHSTGFHALHQQDGKFLEIDLICKSFIAKSIRTLEIRHCPDS